MSAHNVRSRVFFGVFAVAMLAGCNGALDQPRPGTYRAVVDVGGEELPLQLEIAREGATRLWWTRGEHKLEATELTINQGRLNAQWPGSGDLSLQIRRRELTGTLALKGVARTLPVRAMHGENWLFFAESLTDNVDASGNWQLDCGANTQGTLNLQQSHDRISGELGVAEGSINVAGQVHGDEVRLGGVGATRAVLYRGQINAQGHLEGELLDSDKQHLRCGAARLPAPVEDAAL